MLNWYMKLNVLQFRSSKGILYLGIKWFNQSHTARPTAEWRLEPKVPSPSPLKI